MEIYEFEKCLLDRLNESMSVLSWKDEVIPPSRVRSEWAYFVELCIEPAGWQALWKIPRVVCEELDLRYPTIVFGTVEQVDFKELKATFLVEAVQDKDVHIEERQQVALMDLYPTICQENSELNVERSADCLDKLRFFYSSVWMPWDNDNDEDLNWVEKHLESRIRFCYDLRTHSIKRPLAAHIRTLLAEAKYIQQRREWIEFDINDDDDLDNTQKSQVTDLMRLHLRLAIIRNELEMLENPEMRRIFEESKFNKEKSEKAQKNNEANKCGPISYIVTKPNTFVSQMKLFNEVERRIVEGTLLQMCSSLQECLNICEASEQIFLAPGRHSIKFMEYLNNNGTIIGAISKTDMSENSNEEQVVICSPDDDSILLIFDGDFTLENVKLDCTNVRTGILIKNGNVRLKNCFLIGNKLSSTNVGIQLCGDMSEQLVLQDCSLINFATGLTSNSSGGLILNNCLISNCRIGLDLSNHTNSVHFENTCIKDAARCALYFDSLPLKDTNSKSFALKSTTELERLAVPLQIFGKCEFQECNINVLIINQLTGLMSPHILKSMENDNEDIDTCIE